MKTLYLDCKTGAAGDMLTAALLGLLPEPDKFLKKLNGIGIPNVKTERVEVKKCGISGTGVRVTVDGKKEEDEHHEDEHHEHHNSEEHEHSHTGMSEIREIINGLTVSDKVKSDITAVYNLIAAAESRAHNRKIENIHFHEVGSMDAVADVTAVCMLLDEIHPDRIAASSVGLGGGTVHCAHGTLPVPAPATANILEGVPVIMGNADGELCTPTGAALLKYFTDEFVSEISLTPQKIGVGMGTRDFKGNDGRALLSAVRAFISEDEERTDKIVMLSCNLDDMTGEQLGFASEMLIKRGALDVFTAPIYMKKNRPGVLLNVICNTIDKDNMIRLIFKHTTTLGIRVLAVERHVLERSTGVKQTPYGEVRVKTARGYGAERSKAEYDDLKNIALKNNISLFDIE